MQTIDLPERDVVPTALGFSPDGRLLAVWDLCGVSVIDLTAGTARSLWRTAQPPDRYGRDRNATVGFTADSRGVVGVRYTYRTGTSAEAALCVFDATTGAVVREHPASPWSAVEVGPGGRWVYASMYEKTKKTLGIIRWNPLTGEALPTFGEARRDLFQIAVSTDEKCVVASIYNGVRVLKFTGKEPPKRASKTLESDDSYSQHALTVSADGAFAAASGIHSGGCRVETWVVSSGERTEVAKGSDGFPAGRNVRFHPAKPLLAYCTGTDEVIFWDAASRTEVQRFAWGIEKVSALMFSPDGLRCAAAGAGKVIVWDVDV